MLSAAFLKPYIPVLMRLQLIKVAHDQEVSWKCERPLNLQALNTKDRMGGGESVGVPRWLDGNEERRSLRNTLCR